MSRAEFGRALPDLGLNDCTEEDVDALFDAFDEDGEGEISFRELHRMLRRAEPKKGKVKQVAPYVPPYDTIELRKQIRVELLKMAMGYEMRKTAPKSPSQASQASHSQARRGSMRIVLSGFEEDFEEDAAQSLDENVKKLQKERQSAVTRQLEEANALTEVVEELEVVERLNDDSD